MDSRTNYTADSAVTYNDEEGSEYYFSSQPSSQKGSLSQGKGTLTPLNRPLCITPTASSLRPSPQIRHSDPVSRLRCRTAERLLRPIRQVLSNDDINDIRAYIQQQRALGNDRFRELVERKLGRCASVWPAHRPPHLPSQPIRHSDPVFPHPIPCPNPGNSKATPFSVALATIAVRLEVFKQSNCGIGGIEIKRVNATISGMCNRVD